MTKTCEHMREWLPEYAEGTLDGRRAAALERHLAACPRCTAEVADLRTVLSSLHRLDSEPLPVHALAGVRAVLRRTAPAPRPRVRVARPLWPRLALPIAAATGAVALGFMLHGSHSPVTTAASSGAQEAGQVTYQQPPARGVVPAPQAAAHARAPRTRPAGRANKILAPGGPQFESAPPAPEMKRALKSPVAHEPAAPPAPEGLRAASPKGAGLASPPPQPGAYSGPPLPPALLRAEAEQAARQAAAAKAGATRKPVVAPKRSAPPAAVSGPARPPGPSGSGATDGLANDRARGTGRARTIGGPARRANGGSGPGGPSRDRYPESRGFRAGARPDWYRGDRTGPYLPPRVKDRAGPRYGYPGAAIGRGPRGAAALQSQIPLITLRLAPESLGRDVEVRASGRVIWSTATAHGQPITLTASQVGAGPAAIPITVSSKSATRSYTLFVPALAHLGEAVPGQMKHYRNATLSAVLRDVSSRTGLVLLAEGPLNRKVQCDLPLEAPAKAVAALARAAGFKLSTADELVYHLSLE